MENGSRIRAMDKEEILQSPWRTIAWQNTGSIWPRLQSSLLGRRISAEAWPQHLGQRPLAGAGDGTG